MGFKLKLKKEKSYLVCLKFHLKGTKIFKNLMKIKETNQIIIKIIIIIIIEKTKEIRIFQNLNQTYPIEEFYNLI